MRQRDGLFSEQLGHSGGSQGQDENVIPSDEEFAQKKWFPASTWALFKSRTIAMQKSRSHVLHAQNALVITTCQIWVKKFFDAQLQLLLMVMTPQTQARHDGIHCLEFLGTGPSLHWLGSPLGRAKQDPPLRPATAPLMAECERYVMNSPPHELRNRVQLLSNSTILLSLWSAFKNETLNHVQFCGAQNLRGHTALRIGWSTMEPLDTMQLTRKSCHQSWSLATENV